MSKSSRILTGERKLLSNSRRGFLRNSVALGAGASVMSSMGISKAMAQSNGDYKAMVCIFLYGGNDSFNMVVPRSDSAYQQYAQARQTLAVDQSALLPITAASADGNEYGFHPGMEAAQTLFQTGNLAIQANVGALVEPTTRDSYLGQTVALPPRLFSHNDQQDFWQSLAPEAPMPVGWAGRLADLLGNQNTNQQLSMNISLSGANLMQFSSSGLPYNVSPSGVIPLLGVSPDAAGQQEQRRAQAYQALLEKNNLSLFSDEFANTRLQAQALAGDVGGALENVAPFNTSFPQGQLGASLNMVAQLIGASDALDMSRQIFFVGFGGWDTHSDQATRHPLLLTELSEAMASFYAATEELGLQNSVTTFTAADFGRTLTSNGDGSDHGWGGHQLLMGGAVRGQDIYGVMPEIEIGGEQDSGQGRIIPTTSVDQYGATLARWFGVEENQLNSVFPNLANFSSSDIGFML